MAETRMQVCSWGTCKLRTEKHASLLPPHIRNIFLRLNLHLFRSLQSVLHTYRKAESHLPHSIQTWICAHCIPLTELRSSAQYCITAFTLACHFAISVPLKRILQCHYIHSIPDWERIHVFIAELPPIYFPFTFLQKMLLFSATESFRCFIPHLIAPSSLLGSEK